MLSFLKTKSAGYKVVEQKTTRGIRYVATYGGAVIGTSRTQGGARWYCVDHAKNKGIS